MACSHQLRRREGFTLIEVVVVVAIIGVLLSIGLPVLANVRGAADRRAEEKRQNEAHFALRYYAMDHRGEFPYFGAPGTLDAPLSFGEFQLCRTYWAQGYCWAAYVTEIGYHTGLFEGPPPQDDSPSSRPRHARHVDQWLTLTAFASPSYFGEFADQRLELHQPQRWTFLSHPSRKGVLIKALVERSMPSGEPDTTQVVTFADGHTETRPMREFRRGVRLFYWNSAESPVLTTRDGLKGRDI